MSGTLFVVATPIGNLADVSPRALEVLASVDLIACEDTRTTRVLLARHGIRTPTEPLHEHNERQACARVLKLLSEGKSVAVVSDAGTPALSDPGALVVAEAHRAGVRVSPVPGPSAAAAAFSAAGFPDGRFLFAGFLPASRTGRVKALKDLRGDCPIVLYEAPHRILETVDDLRGRFGAEREVVIARELTKKFEQVARMKLGEAAAWLSGEPQRLQGEFVLVIASAEPEPADSAEAERVLEALLEVLAPSEAAKVAAKLTGLPRRLLYEKALARGK